jgi:hypothetical protein
MIFLIRLLHGLITIFFLTCIGYIYYSGITGDITAFSYLAIAAIIVEGIVVGLNKGICPLGTIHHKYGDDKTFFELFLPKKAAKLAIPVLGTISLLGSLLILLH